MVDTSSNPQLQIAELALKRWKNSADSRTDRTNRYLLYFTHWNMEQWLKSEEPAGDRPKISLFLSFDTIRQYISKLFPGRADIGIKIYPDKTETQKDSSEQENHVLNTYDDNKMPLKLHEQAKWFFVGGDACFFVPHDSNQSLIGGADAKIFSLNPITVSIGFVGGQKVYGMHESSITAQQARKLDFVNLNSSIFDDEELSDIYYFDLYNYVRVINYDITSSKILPNPYSSGYEIPYFWLPNNSNPGTINGNSELRHLRILDKEYNFRISDYAERLRSAVLGPLFVSGAGNNKSISLDKDCINFLAAGGKAERLGLPGDSKDFLEYFKLLDDILARKTTISSDTAATKINAVSSGVALQYRFLSLQELIDEKRLTWDDGLKEINKQILYYKFGSDHKFRNKPIYPSMLPTDNAQVATTNVLLVQSGLKSRKAAIDELNPYESAEDVIAEIDADKKLNPDFYKKPLQNNFPPTNSPIDTKQINKK